MDPIIFQIRQELSDMADPQLRDGARRFFKEEVHCYGTKTAEVTTLAKKYWKEVKGRSKEDIFRLCDELYRSGLLEESFIVSSWTNALSDRFGKEDLRVFERWIDSYISNWASCDSFCNHAVGDFMVRFPDRISELERWTSSENRWKRRAAAVSLIIPAKHGMFLSESMAIASLLLEDRDDMVQKGYGWLLKEASRQHTPEIFGFVMERRKVMPRTALRYAIELMPAELKAEAMKRER